jgi:hypothetical protein
MVEKNKLLNQIVLEGQKKRPELETSYIDLLFRKISKYVSFLLIKLGFKPNSVTFLAIIFSITGGYYLSIGNNTCYLIGGLLFFLFLLFDYCDGEVARVLNKYSISGHYLDYVAHFIMFASFMIGLSIGIYKYHKDSMYLILGLFGTAGILLRNIADLLVKEVIIKENIRYQKKIKNSNQVYDYNVKRDMTISVENINHTDKSLIKRLILFLIQPTCGDDILFFYVPFSIVIFMMPFTILNAFNLRLVDIYFFYLCSINSIIPFLLINRHIKQNRLELYYENVFGPK